MHGFAHGEQWSWIAASVLVTITTCAYAQTKDRPGKYDSGASDTEIKIGQTMPFSGPVSANGTIGRTEAAYFKMLNERGGINGRKIKLIAYDDAYSPPKTVEQVRRLVESDEVLLTFQILGTAPNAAVQKYLNQKQVPQLFAATGASRFSDPGLFPWTMSFNPNYRTEGRAYGRFILSDYPMAKIGIIYQNDDLGRDYVAGLKEALGDRGPAIVAEVPYEVSDPTVDSQVVRLKGAGADLLYNVTTPKFAAQVIKKAAEIGWRPIHILNINASSVEAVLRPAGIENAQGIISINYLKDPKDAIWRDDPGVKAYFEFMRRYYPDGDSGSLLNSYGYTVAQLMELVLRRCGDDLTRANIMATAASLRDVSLDLYLPGITINTAPDDYRVNKSFRMMRFKGESWEMIGPIITDSGK